MEILMTCILGLGLYVNPPDGFRMKAVAPVAKTWTLGENTARIMVRMVLEKDGNPSFDFAAHRAMGCTFEFDESKIDRLLQCECARSRCK